MQGNLEHLNDDILLGIFGRLSAGDVLQCRRVCKRMSQLTREYTLWTTIHQRSEAPLPVMNWTIPAAELEKVVGRAEAVDARWTNPCPTISSVHDSLTLHGVAGTDHTVCVGIKGSYAVFLCMFFHRDLVTFQWHKVGGPDGVSLDPVFQHDCIWPGNLDIPSETGLDNMVSYEMDLNTGTLNIACANEGGKFLELTRIELGEKFEPQVQVFEISVWDATSYFGIKVVNGFVVCSKGAWSENQLFEIICIRTGKKIRTLIRSNFPPKDPLSPETLPQNYETKIFITTHHFIRVLDKKLIEVYELPDMLSATGSSDNTQSEPGTLRSSFFGTLPLRLMDVYVFPSPQQDTLIIVGGRRTWSYLPDGGYSVILMTLNVTKQSMETSDEGITMGGATPEAERRLMLTYHPATHCITGIAITTVFTVKADPSAPGHRDLKYLKVSLDSAGSPTMVATWLDIPKNVLNTLRLLEGIDAYNGRLMFKSIATGQCLIGLLEYL